MPNFEPWDIRRRNPDRRAVLRGALGCVGAAILVPGPRPALAAREDLVLVGISSDVVNKVEGRLPDDTLIARVALHEDMYFDEMLKSDPDAQLLIELRDGSTFELGPDAAIRIDRFIFDPEGGMADKSVEILHGAFRYVSGIVSEDQTTDLMTPHGTLGIRGSVVVGLVDPQTPTFMHVAQGEARFSNAGGASEMRDGDSIAVGSASEAPMRPADMPPALALQALALAVRKLPAVKTVATRPPTPPKKTAAMGKANAVSTEAQAARQTTRTPTRSSAPTVSIARDVPDLNEARAVGLLAATPPATPTPSQKAVIDRLAATSAEARAAVATLTGELGAMHPKSVRRGTATVVRGLANAITDPERLARIVARAAAANPSAAAVAAHAAVIATPKERQAVVVDHVVRAVTEAAPAEAEHVKAAVTAAKAGNKTPPALNGPISKPTNKRSNAGRVSTTKAAPSKAAPSKGGATGATKK